MKERPILFKGEMVRAILGGRKTQTRRVMKVQPSPCDHAAFAEADWKDQPPLFEEHPEGWWCSLCGNGANSIGDGFRCPHGKVGDRIWVKETYLPKVSGTIYRADFDTVEAAGIGAMYGGWKPSIFCTRKASRITLEITGIRVERLQDISEADAKAEGVALYLDGFKNYESKKIKPASAFFSSARRSYVSLWESINGADSWKANPWVWVIEFKKL